ncbi:MAG: hypothetical protein JST00_44320 [Deltaproteobacteria bacterium]|nr:hypothetical protein [Deltaproteobacteria bacterium]
MLRPLGSMTVACACVALATVAACAKANLPDEEGDPLDLPDRVAGEDASVAPVDASTDADTPGTDAGLDAPAGPLAVFVSSTTRNARYGGQAGADAVCNALAKAAGLPGTFIAWLSNKNGPNAVQRLTSPGLWTLVGGVAVATTKTELVSGTLKHAIDRDEKGAVVPPSKVWTGTGANGLYETNDCDAWSTGNNGRSGQSDQVNATWTSSTVDDCDQLHRVYCFQN